MTTLREAAQQTLEAWDGGDTEWFKRAYTVMEALRAALEEPVLNPAPGYCKHCKQYTIEEPLPAEPVQEPVYWEVRCTAHPKWMRVDEQQFDEYVANGWEGQRLYAAPPQRKPLSEEEIWALYYALPSDDFERSDRIDFARAIERAHNIT